LVMSKHFWVQIRLLGWFIILLWYVIYTIDAINPILNNQLIAVSHGIHRNNRHSTSPYRLLRPNQKTLKIGEMNKLMDALTDTFI
jgi:hypothetical protein